MRIQKSAIENEIITKANSQLIIHSLVYRFYTEKQKKIIYKIELILFYFFLLEHATQTALWILFNNTETSAIWTTQFSARNGRNIQARATSVLCLFAWHKCVTRSARNFPNPPPHPLSTLAVPPCEWCASNVFTWHVENNKNRKNIVLCCFRAHIFRRLVSLMSRLVETLYTLFFSKALRKQLTRKYMCQVTF